MPNAGTQPKHSSTAEAMLKEKTVKTGEFCFTNLTDTLYVALYV
jgi:hypothetical protein